jgi:predicted ATPase/DNA-binding XRE family transcriptional regulator
MTQASGTFGAQLRALREAAGFTQEELATVAGLSVHAISALERGERRRPQVDTVRALSAALDLTGAAREALVGSARRPADTGAADRRDVHLPLPLTALVGRAHDIHALRQILADSHTRLVTIVGPGGVGKTRVGLELARAAVHDGVQRVVFVALAPIADASFVAPAIAEAFELSDVTVSELPTRMGHACADRPTLLLLDNFEHVLDAAALVVELLTAIPVLRVLVTSRAPLRVRGEREYLLGPLALDERGPAPAIHLFVERVRDVQPGFELTPANSRTVTAICRRLDALPLALELAAPWMKVLEPRDLLRRLEHDVLLTPVSRRDLPQRQQTMNATVAWSYQLLDANDRRAFRRLGVLPGLFPMDAARAVIAGVDSASEDGDAALAVIARLIDKSLLQPPPSTEMATCALYQMLETVRAYARLELVAAGEHDDAMAGQVRYCLAEAALAAEGLVSAAQIEWLHRVREDLDTYRSAMTWLVERRRPLEAATIVSSLLIFWIVRGHVREGLRWCDAILRLPSLPPRAETDAGTCAALMRFAQGDLEGARVIGHRAHDLARASRRHDVVVAQLENVLGRIEYGSGNMQAAGEWFARSLDRSRALQQPWGIGSALTAMSRVLLWTGDVEGAERMLDEASDVLREAAPWFRVLCWYPRSILAVRRQQPGDAIALGRESLKLIRDLQDRFALVYALDPLAIAATIEGDDDRAARLVGARDAVTERTGAIVVDEFTRTLREEAEQRARQRLGPERWTRAYETGKRMSIDELVQMEESRPRSVTG